MSYFYVMDIRQTITKFQDLDIEAMDRTELVSFIGEVRQEEERFRQFLNQFTTIRSQAQNKIWEIDHKEQVKRNEEAQMRMAEKGFKIGAIFYIDRHDGIYIVSSVDDFHVSFTRMMEGKTRGKTIHMEHNRIDPRLTPIRSEGPFKPGDTVMRYDHEFLVEGYLGIRMLLSRSYSFSSKAYTIVRKKDEATYRSIII